MYIILFRFTILSMIPFLTLPIIVEQSTSPACYWTLPVIVEQSTSPACYWTLPVIQESHAQSLTSVQCSWHWPLLPLTSKVVVCHSYPVPLYMEHFQYFVLCYPSRSCMGLCDRFSLSVSLSVIMHTDDTGNLDQFSLCTGRQQWKSTFD